MTVFLNACSQFLYPCIDVHAHNFFAFLPCLFDRLSITEPLAFPVNLKIASLLPNAITYTWNKTHSFVQQEPNIGYEYRFLNGHQELTTGFIHNFDDMQYIARYPKLQENCYTFSVAAVNHAGTGPHCPPIVAGPPPIGKRNTASLVQYKPFILNHHSNRCHWSRTWKWSRSLRMCMLDDPPPYKISFLLSKTNTENCLLNCTKRYFHRLLTYHAFQQTKCSYI